MFEGLVRQVLLGYIGRYVKDIQKEQLKIKLWNEEVLLENVELILETFDYLRLPFALREGSVREVKYQDPLEEVRLGPYHNRPGGCVRSPLIERRRRGYFYLCREEGEACSSQAG